MPDSPVTLAWLRSKRASLIERADAAVDRGDMAEARSLAEKAIALETLIEIHGEQQGLTSGKKNRSVSVVNTQGHIARRDKPGRPLKSKHPFPRALDKAGKAVETWAREHGLKSVTVRAWYATGDGGRRIPRAMADVIESELGVPASQDVWKNGIR